MENTESFMDLFSLVPVYKNVKDIVFTGRIGSLSLTRNLNVVLTLEHPLLSVLNSQCPTHLACRLNYIRI